MLKFHFSNPELYALLNCLLINLCIHFLAIYTHGPYNVFIMYLQGKIDHKLKYISFVSWNESHVLRPEACSNLLNSGFQIILLHNSHV